MLYGGKTFGLMNFINKLKMTLEELSSYGEKVFFVLVGRTLIIESSEPSRHKVPF